MFTFAPLYYLMTLQQQMPNGMIGATGPNAQPLVARGPKSGPVLAVTQLLGGMCSVLENPRRLTIAQYQSAKVAVTFIFAPFCNADSIAAVAAKWQEWGQWSECSVSCGQGSKLRSRACSGALFGGDENCPGHSTEAGVCDITKWTCGRSPNILAIPCP